MIAQTLYVIGFASTVATLVKGEEMDDVTEWLLAIGVGILWPIFMPLVVFCSEEQLEKMFYWFLGDEDGKE